jgi:hypothetical protein
MVQRFGLRVCPDGVPPSLSLFEMGGNGKLLGEKATHRVSCRKVRWPNLTWDPLGPIRIVLILEGRSVAWVAGVLWIRIQKEEPIAMWFHDPRVLGVLTCPVAREEWEEDSSGMVGVQERVDF